MSNDDRTELNSFEQYADNGNYVTEQYRTSTDTEEIFWWPSTWLLTFDLNTSI